LRQHKRPIDFLKSPLSKVMVVSYEMLLRSFDDVQRVDFGLIVCDEGHRLKNAGNKTSSVRSCPTQMAKLINANVGPVAPAASCSEPKALTTVPHLFCLVLFSLRKRL